MAREALVQRERTSATERRRILFAAGAEKEVHRLVEELTGEFDVALVESAADLAQILAQYAPDVIILDAELPGTNGRPLCREIKEGPMGCLTQIVLVGRDGSGCEYLRAYEMGADDYLTWPLDSACLRAKLLAQIRFRTVIERVWELNARMQEFNHELERLVEARSRELLEVRDLAIFTLAKLAESRDPETGEHLERMRWYSRIIAEELGADPAFRDSIPPHFAEEVFRSAPLHDIGKVGIPDAILLKPGRLTPQEFEIMKQHTVLGYRALQEALEKNPAGSFLAQAAEIARWHHERFDGTGYPDGLAGEAIPLSARVVTVADVFDALTSPRVYKKAVEPEFARRIILREAGHQFDPRVVAAFDRRWKHIQEVGRPFWESLPPEKIDQSFPVFQCSSGAGNSVESASSPARVS